MTLVQQLAALRRGELASIAGVGYREGAAAKETDVGWPMGVVRLAGGDIVFCDVRGHRLWRIAGDGILHSFAGDGVPGNEGDGGPAGEGRVFTPHDLCLDRQGNLFFSQLGARGPDEGPNTIRRIDAATGEIATVVGSGRQGRGAEGLRAREAELDTTCGVAVDADGGVFICGKWDSCVFRVDPGTELVSRIAGQTTRHPSLEQGDRRPFSGSGYSLAGYHGDGGPATAAALRFPEHLAFDSRRNLYICDNGNHRIRRVDARSGVIVTVFGTGRASSAGDDGPATAASSNGPDGIFVDVHDNLYVGESSGYRLRKVSARTGVVTSIAGTGEPGWGGEDEPAVRTRCNHLESGVWADADGVVLFSDASGRLRQIDTSGIVSTVAGGTSIHDGGPAASAFLGCPRGVCVGADGTIYFADMVHDRIRAIDGRSGEIRTVVGSGGRGFGGDGGPATAAYLLNPYDVALDRAGRVVVADSLNARVRRVEHDGRIQTIAGTGEGSDRGDGGPARNASFAGVHGITCGVDGDLYVGDTAGRLRALRDGGDGAIQTVAGVGIPGWSGDGGPARDARIGTPSAIACDDAGNLYFADLTQHVVRKIDRGGLITTIAGTGQAGYSVDGTLATAARLHRPLGIAVRSDGVVFFSDGRNNRVRRVGADGVLMTAAGADVGGDSAGPTPAVGAPLNEPHGLCFLDDELLLICDHYNNRIKAVRTQ